MARALLVPATIGLTLAATTIPALARDANAGEIWIDTVGQAAGPGQEHDPHLPCADLNLWGAKLAPAAGTFTIESWPPSGGRQQVYASATSSAGWQSSGTRAPQVIAMVRAEVLITNAVAAGAQATAQGFHFRLQLGQDPQKHKTFWLQCPQPVRPPPVGGGGGSSGGGGTSGGGGPPRGSGPSGSGGPSGSPGQQPGGEPSISSGGNSISTGPNAPIVVPLTLAQTGSPLAVHSDPYAASLPLLVLALLVALRPRQWIRLLRGTRAPAAAA